MKKLLMVMLSLAFVTTSAEAQFLKNLKKKVEDKVEKTVSDKVADKAAQEADKTLEEMWTPDMDESAFAMGADRVPAEEIPASYNFDWEYTLTMQTENGDMDMVYLLPENGTYSGIRMSQAGGMLVVNDAANEMTVMYMNSGGGSMVTATKITSAEEMESEEMVPYEDMEMRKVGTKTILGYHCQGYEMENEDYLMTFYVTDEAEISFNQMAHTDQNKMPQGFDPEWLKDGEGLMMQMEMQNKNEAAEKMIMTCTGIEKKPFTINTSDYQTF